MGKEKPHSKTRKKASGGSDPAALSLSKGMREISISEFFTKNRHLLGFDNSSKALLTTVREAVDNSLDACEEAGILPDLSVDIASTSGEDRFIVTAQDNGPGIMPAQIPRVFGKLLYGSRFHTLRMARGQQGIGISAAGMYGQLTTGKPVKVWSRISPDHPAIYCEILIDTAKNEPEVANLSEVPWEPPSGTRVQIELTGKFQRGKWSVEEYLRQTAIANPHAEILYRAPDGETLEFRRASSELPPKAKEVKPHPHGIELGVLIRMLKETSARTLKSFLTSDFSRVSPRVADEICAKAKLSDRSRPTRIAKQEADALFKAIEETKLMKPATDSLVPIGEELILTGLKKEIQADFYACVSRPPQVYRGNPFQIEAGLAYGGGQPGDEPIRIMRFANRVPLLYQQSACAIARAVSSVAWRHYGLSQPKGSLPIGSVTLTVHIASVWVPFTSESKEAVAHYPAILKEIRLAVQECGRKLGLFLSRRRRALDAERKLSYIETYIPHIVDSLASILHLEDLQKETLKENLVDVLERSRG